MASTIDNRPQKELEGWENAMKEFSQPAPLDQLPKEFREGWEKSDFNPKVYEHNYLDWITEAKRAHPEHDISQLSQDAKQLRKERLADLLKPDKWFTDVTESCRDLLANITYLKSRLKRADHLRAKADKFNRLAATLSVILVILFLFLLARLIAGVLDSVSYYVTSFLWVGLPVIESIIAPLLTFLLGLDLFQWLILLAAAVLALTLPIYLLRCNALKCYLSESDSNFKVGPKPKVMKRIILCCDGTWNAPGRSEATNVELIKRMIRDDQDTDGVEEVEVVVTDNRPGAERKVKQVFHYIRGVGTQKGWRNCTGRFLGGATGYGIKSQIKEGYDFLASEYEPDDEIYLFGFSRGAYTVRSLTGLIYAVGLLLPSALDHIPRLYRAYQKRTLDQFHSDYEDILRNLRDYSRLKGEGDKPTLPVRFLGVWDTVGALGAPTPLLKWLTKRMGWVSFHNTQLAGTVENAYQALALHELRQEFEPAIWTHLSPGQKHVEQKWFRGAHADVGGGYKERRISDVSLRWMMESAGSHGLKFTKEGEDFLRNTQSTYDNAQPHLSRSWKYKLFGPLLVRPIGIYLTEKKRVSLNEYTQGETQGMENQKLSDAEARCFNVIEELRGYLPISPPDPQQDQNDWETIKEVISKGYKQFEAGSLNDYWA